MKSEEYHNDDGRWKMEDDGTMEQIEDYNIMILSSDRLMNKQLERHDLVSSGM